MTKSPKIYPTNAELWLNMHSSGARHPSIHAFIHCSCYALPEVIPVWGVYTTFLCMSVPAKATLPRAMHATRVIGGDLHRHRVVVAAPGAHNLNVGFITHHLLNERRTELLRKCPDCHNMEIAIKI